MFDEEPIPGCNGLYTGSFAVLPALEILFSLKCNHGICIKEGIADVIQEGQTSRNQVEWYVCGSQSCSCPNTVRKRMQTEGKDHQDCQQYEHLPQLSMYG